MYIGGRKIIKSNLSQTRLIYCKASKYVKKIIKLRLLCIIYTK